MEGGRVGGNRIGGNVGCLVGPIDKMLESLSVGAGVFVAGILVGRPLPVGVVV